MSFGTSFLRPISTPEVATKSTADQYCITLLKRLTLIERITPQASRWVAVPAEATHFHASGWKIENNYSKFF